MEAYINVLNRYRAERKISEKEQLSELKKTIRKAYENKEKSVVESIEQDSLPLQLVVAAALLSDALAFVVKGIAELYNQEFWELWKQMGISGLRHFEEIYNKEKYYIKPITTAEFLNISPNDLIYFWSETAKFDFSDELYMWFELLKWKFDIAIKNEEGLLEAFEEEPLRHIVDIMEAAEENYYHILTFTEFLKETKEHIKDKRYWALWKIYEDMIFAPELIKAGSVIFATERTENIQNGFCENKRKSKRALITDWTSIPREEKDNKGRRTLRRYMALVANKKLRYKVFGF